MESSFDELGSFYNGLSGKSKDDFGQGSDRFITYMNVYKNTIAAPDGCELVLVEDGEHQNRVEYGDILFTQSSETLEEVGLSSVWLHKASPFLNSFCFGFHFAGKEMINPRFIAYSLRTSYMREKIIREGQGATRYNLSSNRLKPIKLVYPSYQEQSRIASLMSRLETRIEKQQELICTLKKYKRGLLNDMFPQEDATVPKLRLAGFTGEWVQHNLGDLMNVTSVKRIHQSDWTNSGVRFLRARDIVAASKNEKVSEPLFISQEKYNEYSEISGKVKKGDLLVTGVGTIGVPMLINSDEPLYFKDGNIIWFKNENIIDGKFFYYSFVSDGIQKFILESAGTGTVGTYTIDSGRKTPVYLPVQREEQIQIGKYFSQLDALIVLHQRKLDILMQCKNGIVQQLFI